MAVTMNMKDPWKVISNLGISESTVESLKAANVEIMITPTLIKLIKGGIVLETMTVVSGALSLIIKGQLGAASKQALAHNFSKLVPKAIEKAGGISSYSAPMNETGAIKPDTQADIISKTGEWKKLEPKILKPAVEKSGDACTESEMITDVPVKLMATKRRMYQPVSGTSPGARYFVVGWTKDLKIAARRKNATLSIRAEGDVVKHKTALEQAGFGVGNIAQGYVSVHFEVGVSDVSFARTLGAVLSGLGMVIESPMPVANMLKNKGS